MVEEKYGLRETRRRYPAALAMGVHAKSMSLLSPAMNMGAMLAGEIGVGGPTSLLLAIFVDSFWKLTFSKSARWTVSLPRTMSPDPFFTRISCLSELGSLRTIAALSGAKEAVAPAIFTLELDPCT